MSYPHQLMNLSYVQIQPAAKDHICFGLSSSQQPFQNSNLNPILSPSSQQSFQNSISPSSSEQPSQNSNFNPNLTQKVDYKETVTKTSGIHFLKECCSKLNANILTMATAATYYHKFFYEVKFDDYDPYLIACTSIYLASKVINDDVKIRDIINVGFSCINKEEGSLSLEPYFELRDSLIESELLLMRMLSYDLKVDLPHKHLLFYLNALRDWLPSETFDTFPVVEVCWSILNDSYHAPLVLYHSPELIAASVIHLTFQIYGIIVPSCKESIGQPWYESLHKDCKMNNVWNVLFKILTVYDLEKNGFKSQTN